MIASFKEVATFDENGRVDGMQFDSKQRRLQLWKEKKEAEEFDRLIAKLKQHKNYRAWYTRHRDDPAFQQRMREHNRRMRAKHGARRNAAAREKRQEHAVEVINTCQECGKTFSLPFGYKKKRTSKYCSRVCRNRVGQRASLLRRKLNTGY
jgi:hypothetical protein